MSPMMHDIKTPFLAKAWYGDVAHVRRSSFYGWLIRRALQVWGNHDGILCKRNDEWGVAEAIAPRFRFTPWSEYAKQIDNGKASVVFLRHPEASLIDGVHIAEFANKTVDAAPRYDWRGVWTAFTNTLFKRNCTKNAKWKWYCTEQVRESYRQARPALDVWGDDLPTPYTTEKRHKYQELIFVAQYGDEPYVNPNADRTEPEPHE